MLERDPLRHELADHHVQERDDQEREREGEHGREDRIEDLRKRLLAQRTNAETRAGDTELHGGDEARRVGEDRKHGTRAAVALFLELADARPAGGHEPVLARDEEPVQQDQRCYDEELQEEDHAPLSGAWGLGGISSSTTYDSV